MIYIASPVVNKLEKGSSTTIQVPTFFLDGDIQGIVSVEHAAKIVYDICNPTHNSRIVVHANVFEHGEAIVNAPTDTPESVDPDTTKPAASMMQKQAWLPDATWLEMLHVADIALATTDTPESVDPDTTKTTESMMPKSVKVRKMTPAQAWLYAASWGSALQSGDPGACMYGFNEHCRPQDEAHRQAVIWHCETVCIPIIKEHPEWYDANEMAKMEAFLAFIRVRKIEGC